MRRLAEQLFDFPPHERDARRTADEHDLVDLGRLQLRVGKRLAHGAERALDDRRNARLEGGACQARSVRLPGRRDDARTGARETGNDDFRLIALGQIVLRLDDGLPNRLDDLRHVPAVDVDEGAVLLEGVQHGLDEHLIEVVAAQMGVAVGRQHLKDAVLDAENRDVERAAAKVVDGDESGVPLVETVGERGRGRLVDDAQHVEPGEAAGIARRGALRVVEIRRHGDYRAVHLVVELSLPGKERFRAPLQLAQHERRNLRRRELAVAEADANDAARVAADAKREIGRFVLHVVDALAHETLDRVRGPRRLGREQPPLRLTSDVRRSVALDRHDRRHEPVAALVADHERHAVLHVGDQRVRRAEVDSDDFAHSRDQRRNRRDR